MWENMDPGSRSDGRVERRGRMVRLKFLGEWIKLDKSCLL
jgi:hypothetical protein